MKRAIFFICFICMSSLVIKAQETAEISFTPDTMSFYGNNTVLNGEYVETTLKNQSVVRMFKANNNKYYLRFLVSVNFYFNKTDVLEIRSGKKSYYAEKTTQYKVNKTTGLFIVEIPKNYIAQLKDEGITSIVFSHAETDFTRQDANQIKKIARYFYESIVPKK